MPLPAAMRDSMTSQYDNLWRISCPASKNNNKNERKYLPPTPPGPPIIQPPLPVPPLPPFPTPIQNGPVQPPLPLPPAPGNIGFIPPVMKKCSAHVYTLHVVSQ
ncbi:hypothetical protein DPMN_191719 [Dreissena polymorpha]|uniref:Uncharacterized protein n=1 Tax=Dreissena polymorpha TaxID=45954 RepID=A0A9D4BFD7_DREPO|nr:hypothetical protein DPMN_191719 [Dreissena polymorpha]